MNSPFAAVLAAAFCLSAAAVRADNSFYLKDGETVLFLGDSITQNGRHIAYMDAFIRTTWPEKKIHLVNLGLSSETACGLTEPDHPFPRPNVHERVGRAIEKLKFDTAVICYGMNDGIYHPLSDERFEAYKKGILSLIEKLEPATKRIVLMTPPPFDAFSVRGPLAKKDAPEFGYKTPYASYDDEVIEPYGKWILSLKDKVDLVIDIHSPIEAAIAEKRKADPKFKSGDGVHPNAQGYVFFARAILGAMGVSADDLDKSIIGKLPNPKKETERKIMDLVMKRHGILSTSYRCHVGHKRPGERKNPVPVDDALEAVAGMEDAVRELASP